LIKDRKIEEKDILKIHELFYYMVDSEQAGKYRDEQVFITGTDVVPPSPKQIPTLMKEFCDQIPEWKKKYHPVEYCALLHKKLVMIHPFIDGNGRTARLVMNLALLQHGFVITIIPPVIRADYIDSLKKDDTSFINFISSMVYECQKDYLRLLSTLREG